MQDSSVDEFDLLPTADQLRRWGLEPSWSRRVSFLDARGRSVSWHVLDTGPGPLGTIVCVHGNPSWGYLWRDVLRTLSPEWRVVAVDQSGMGYSERTRPRRLAERVEELVRFCRQEVNGPLVLAAHDWGGPVAVGAARELDVRALILSNTAVAKPDDVRVPPLIAVARALTSLSCRQTPLFVDGAAAMAGKIHREALRAPYRNAARRSAVADFVADIPVRASDPSSSALASSALTFSSLTCPVLLVWGSRDHVFHDRFLRDLRRRLPSAKVERFANAGHFVPLDEPVGTIIETWLTTSLARTEPDSIESAVPEEPSKVNPPSNFNSILSALRDRSSDPSVVYQGPDATMTWRQLDERSSIAAVALRLSGVERGDRVSVLITPSAELIIATIATWKLGAVTVLADSSAGVRALRRLVRSSGPSLVIGTRTSVALARAARFAPGARFAAFAAIPGVTDLRDVSNGGDFEPVVLRSNDLAAVVHTSGATGPAKPVRYTHGALSAQRDALSNLWNIDPHEFFTTSFGSFMLLAPVIGMGFVRPDFNVNRPSELDFDALLASLANDDVTTAWLSPASARSILASAHDRHLALNLVMLAGAPIAPSLVTAIRTVTNADVRAPYGMTECLPVTDGANPLDTAALGGTSSGRPLAGCEVRIAPLDEPYADAPPGSWGEILVSAPWMFDSYDARWSADHATMIVRDGRRFHRTGDVGYLANGLLFQLGRTQHVLHTAKGPLASVALEENVASVTGRLVAAVPVGPSGLSVVALVLDSDCNLRLASDDVARSAREASRHSVAAVLEGRLPTDRRHQSKIDRTALAKSVEKFLAGS